MAQGSQGSLVNGAVSKDAVPTGDRWFESISLLRRVIQNPVPELPKGSSAGCQRSRLARASGARLFVARGLAPGRAVAVPLGPRVNLQSFNHHRRACATAKLAR